MKKASRLSLPERSEIILLIFMEFWRATSASWPFMFKSEVSSPRFCSNSVVQFSVGMQIYIQDLSLDDPQAQRVNWFEYECLHVKIRFVRFREIYEWLCSLTALMLHVIMINTLQQTDNILGKLSVHVRLSLKKKNWCQVNRASEWSVRSDSGPWRWLKWLAIWWMTSRFQTCKDPILL